MMHCFPGRVRAANCGTGKSRPQHTNASLTCVPVRVLQTPLALGAVSLLQEESCSFHHEKALAQAERNKNRERLARRRGMLQREGSVWTHNRVNGTAAATVLRSMGGFGYNPHPSPEASATTLTPRPPLQVCCPRPTAPPDRSETPNKRLLLPRSELALLGLCF